MATRERRGRGGGCLLLLLLLVALGTAAWIGRGAIGDWMGRLELGSPAEASESLARRAEEKLNLIAREGLSEEVRFSEAELQSLLTYRGGPLMPAGIEDARVDVQDSLVVLSARLSPDALEEFSIPDALRSALSDTSRVTTGLAPEIERPGELRLRIRSLQIGALVIPPMMLPAVVGGLEAQGVRTAAGAVVLPVTRDVGTVAIEGDELVLVPAANPGPGGDGSPPEG
ncbi:MAG: hypothetical protein PVF05_05355 [Gemmatimonadales bacterium]|jgi:hypothetical protein